MRGAAEVTRFGKGSVVWCFLGDAPTDFVADNFISFPLIPKGSHDDGG